MMVRDNYIRQIRQLKSHLDGEFKDEFDTYIQSAIDTIESCNRWEEIKE